MYTVMWMCWNKLDRQPSDQRTAGVDSQARGIESFWMTQCRILHVANRDKTITPIPLCHSHAIMNFTNVLSLQRDGMDTNGTGLFV